MTNQSSVHDQIKSRLQSGNACCHSVQNLECSCLLSKSTKIKIHRTIILPFVLYGCEAWSVTWREEHRLRVRNVLVYVITRQVTVISDRHFRTTYRSRLQGSRIQKNPNTGFLKGRM